MWKHPGNRSMLGEENFTSKAAHHVTTTCPPDQMFWVLLSWQDCNHDCDDDYHICPFTDNESAKEGKASVVAECNDDRKVEDKTLKWASLKEKKQFNKCTPVKGLPRKRPWVRYHPSLVGLPLARHPLQMLQCGKAIGGIPKIPPSWSSMLL